MLSCYCKPHNVKYQWLVLKGALPQRLPALKIKTLKEINADFIDEMKYYNLLPASSSLSFIYTWTDGQDPSQNAEIWATTQKTANTKSGKTMSVPERISPHSFKNSENWPPLGVNRAIFEVGFEPFWTIPNRLFRNRARNQGPDQGREWHCQTAWNPYTAKNGG